MGNRFSVTWHLLRAAGCLWEQPLPLILGLVLTLLLSLASLGICTGPLSVGYSRMCLRALSGEQVQVEDVFSGFHPFWGPFTLWSLVACLKLSAIAASWAVKQWAISAHVHGEDWFVLVTLLPLLRMVYYAFLAWVWLLMAGGERDVEACLRGSFLLTANNLGPVLWLMFVASIAACAGLVVLGVGVFFTMPLYNLAMASCCLDLQQDGTMRTRARAGS